MSPRNRLDEFFALFPATLELSNCGMVLPTIVLSTIPLAVIARQTRSAMLEVLGEDYIRTTRAKGLSPSRIIGVHALRNALITVIVNFTVDVLYVIINPKIRKRS